MVLARCKGQEKVWRWTLTRNRRFKKEEKQRLRRHQNAKSRIKQIRHIIQKIQRLVYFN